MAKVTLHKHEVVAKCGSFEVRFHDGRESVYFYWDDIPGRRLKPEQMDSATALEAAGRRRSRLGGNRRPPKSSPQL